MKLFELQKVNEFDQHGDSVVIAQGVVSDTGKCALFWLTEPQTVVYYDNIHTLEVVHTTNEEIQLVYFDSAQSELEFRFMFFSLIEKILEDYNIFLVESLRIPILENALITGARRYLEERRHEFLYE